MRNPGLHLRCRHWNQSRGECVRQEDEPKSQSSGPACCTKWQAVRRCLGVTCNKIDAGTGIKVDSKVPCRLILPTPSEYEYPDDGLWRERTHKRSIVPARWLSYCPRFSILHSRSAAQKPPMRARHTDVFLRATGRVELGIEG